MDYHITSAEKRHLDALSALERECFSVPWTRAQLTAELPDGHHEFLVAESGDTLLGYVGMMYVLDEGYISNVAVSLAYRRQGIASALMSAFLRQAKSEGRDFVLLTCHEAKIGMYEHMGFKELGLSNSVWGGVPWREMICDVRD